MITWHNTVPLFLFFIAAFGINSILYQRGIYPPETFTRVNHYDMSLLVTTDCILKKYLSDVVSQLKGALVWFLKGVGWMIVIDRLRSTAVVQDRSWDSKISAFNVLNLFVLWHSEWLNACTVKKLVLVVTCLETNEVLERWQFDIECDKTAKECRSGSPPSRVNFILPNNICLLCATGSGGIPSKFQQVATMNHLQQSTSSVWILGLFSVDMTKHHTAA